MDCSTFVEKVQCGHDTLIPYQEEYKASFASPPGGNVGGGASGSFVKKSHDGTLMLRSYIDVL